MWEQERSKVGTVVMKIRIYNMDTPAEKHWTKGPHTFNSDTILNSKKQATSKDKTTTHSTSLLLTQHWVSGPPVQKFTHKRRPKTRAVYIDTA